MNIKSEYLIPMPVIPANTEAFEFQCNISEGAFSFLLRWNKFKTGWSMYVTIPSGEVRPAAVWPNCTSWSRYPDFAIRTETDICEIGINDIQNVKIILMVLK